MRPKTLVSAAPSAKIATICRKFATAVGFSNGCAALTLKKPPPLVPSILIATCEATGPMAMVCRAPSRVVASIAPARVCGMPCATSTSASTAEIGSRTNSVIRVRSTQKLPTLRVEARAKPRITATATAMPVAAETKFCTVRPAIWVRWLMVVSPP